MTILWPNGLTTPPAEEWRAVVGYEGSYEVSSHGRVRSVDRVIRRPDTGRGATVLRRGKSLRTVIAPGGYVKVELSRDASRKACFVHRLVLEAFVGPCPDGQEGCHNDGDPANNSLGNLRWDTHSANVLDKRRHGTDATARITHCPRGHRLLGANLIPSRLRRGQRECLACSRARSLARKQRVAFSAGLADKYYAQLESEAA